QQARIDGIDDGGLVSVQVHRARLGQPNTRQELEYSRVAKSAAISLVGATGARLPAVFDIL
ncbi:MAG: hypothetical protein ACPGIJ_03465, partial [Mycobacterium sp.]